MYIHSENVVKIETQLGANVKSTLCVCVCVCVCFVVFSVVAVFAVSAALIVTFILVAVTRLCRSLTDA